MWKHGIPGFGLGAGVSSVPTHMHATNTRSIKQNHVLKMMQSKVKQGFVPTDCTNAIYGCGRYDSKNQENSDDCALDDECHGEKL